MIEKVMHRFVLRCSYPEELLDLVHTEGFRMTATCGGYEGATYGKAGADQVVEFST